MKIRKRLPYVEVNRGKYRRFKGIEVAVGKRLMFRFEIHLYKRGMGVGGYTNFVRMG